MTKILDHHVYEWTVRQILTGAACDRTDVYWAIGLLVSGITFCVLALKCIKK